MPLPKSIRNAPSLQLGLDIYYTAFQELSSEGHNGLIPWTSIQMYCERKGFNERQTAAAHHHIIELDRVRNAFYEKKGKKKDGKLSQANAKTG